MLVGMDEREELEEDFRYSFVPKYLLSCIFFQPHEEIEMKALSLIFQIREKYGINVDKENCLELRYQEWMGNS